MNADYADIRELTAADPQWFDEQAVPRYIKFDPRWLANIYADEAVLMHIKCQRCGKDFMVACSSRRFAHEPLSQAIQTREIHYGDPPNIGCCDSGPSMNSVPQRVVEYWSRHKREFTKPCEDNPKVSTVTDIKAYMHWTRDPSLEVDVVPDWAKD